MDNNSNVNIYGNKYYLYYYLLYIIHTVDENEKVAVCQVHISRQLVNNSI